MRLLPARIAAVMLVVAACSGTADDTGVEGTAADTAAADAAGEGAPRELPPTETWTWERADGDAATLPQSAPSVRIDGDLVAVDFDDSSQWWRSSDGLTWKTEPVPEVIGAGVVYLASVGGSVFAFG